jgi:hypothetical protein
MKVFAHCFFDSTAKVGFHFSLGRTSHAADLERKGTKKKQSDGPKWAAS